MLFLGYWLLYELDSCVTHSIRQGATTAYLFVTVPRGGAPGCIHVFQAESNPTP